MIKIIRGLDIGIAKKLGYKSHSDMDFGSYLTYPIIDAEGEQIDYCPPRYKLYGSEEEAWEYGVPYWVEWFMVFIIISSAVLMIGLL